MPAYGSNVVVERLPMMAARPMHTLVSVVDPRVVGHRFGWDRPGLVTWNFTMSLSHMVCECVLMSRSLADTSTRSTCKYIPETKMCPPNSFADCMCGMGRQNAALAASMGSYRPVLDPTNFA